jgi:hypothetical protein
MSVTAEPSSQRLPATNRVDQNGVPTIASSVPLAILGFGLLLGIPLMSVGLFDTLRMAATGEATDGQEIWELSADYRRMLWIVGGLGALLLGWMAATAYFFFLRRSAVVRMLKILLVSAIALNVLATMWDASYAEEGAVWVLTIISLIGSTIVPIIWLIYLWRSSWVKQVFVYPLDGTANNAS